MATHDPRLEQRLDYIISEMAEAQRGYDAGYIDALLELRYTGLKL